MEMFTDLPFPLLEKNQVALFRVDFMTGHVLDENYNLNINNKNERKIYSIFNTLDLAKEYITEQKIKYKDIEYTIYGKYKEIICHITPIDIARENFITASTDIGFKIITPYFYKSNNHNRKLFAFLPEYGSVNGLIIDLIFPPYYKINYNILEISKELNCYCSFIDIEKIQEYKKEYYLEKILIKKNGVRPNCT